MKVKKASKVKRQAKPQKRKVVVSKKPVNSRKAARPAPRKVVPKAAEKRSQKAVSAPATPVTQPPVAESVDPAQSTPQFATAMEAPVRIPEPVVIPAEIAPAETSPVQIPDTIPDTSLPASPVQQPLAEQVPLPEKGYKMIEVRVRRNIFRPVKDAELLLLYRKRCCDRVITDGKGSAAFMHLSDGEYEVELSSDGKLQGKTVHVKRDVTRVRFWLF